MAHILFITHWFPTIDHPVNGIFVREHARAASVFHKVTVIHLLGNVATNPGISFESDHGLNIYRVRYPKPIIPKSGLISQWKALRQIISVLNAQGDKPDIVHACVYTSADIAFLISRIHRIPAVLTEQSSAYARNLIPWYKAIVYRYCLNRMKLIMPISQELINQMIDFGIRVPYEIIPNAVDTTQFFPNLEKQDNSNDPLQVITVALLHPIKGIDLLLKAFAQLKLSRKWQLTIIGDGPERNFLTDLSHQLKIDSRASFLGNKNKQEISDLMRASDLFILTSHYETQGVVFIEAMASGLPVMAPDVGGVPEIVKPFCGVLFTPGDLKMAVDRLEYMLTHLHHYSSDKISNYAMSEYSFSAIGRKFSDVYKRVLE